MSLLACAKRYLAALEAFSIGRLTSQSLPGSNQPLKWRHLLAWCIRDQHKRFDGFYNWRDGEGMGFTRPRRDQPAHRLGTEDDGQLARHAHMLHLDHQLGVAQRDVEEELQPP